MADVAGRILDRDGEGINLAHPSFHFKETGHSDQEAVEAWLTALQAGNGRRGILPPGMMATITSTLLVQNVVGLTIEGPGEFGFTFLWDGPANQPMWQLNNCQQCEFADFSVQSYPAKPLDVAFHIQNLAAPIPSDANVFRRVDVEGTDLHGLNRAFVIEPVGGANGVGVENVDINNDFMTLEHVGVYNYSEEAVLIQGFNAHHIQMLYCDFIAAVDPAGVLGKHAVRCNAGFFTLRGGRIAGNKVADFYVLIPNGAIVISEVNVENSKRLLVTEGLTGFPQPITIQGIRWAGNQLHSDGRMIIQRNPGPLTLRGNMLGDPGVPVTPKVDVSAIGTYGFVSQGNCWGGVTGITTSPYVLATAAGSPLPVRISIEGDIFVNANSGGIYNPRAFANGDQAPKVHTGHVFFTQNTSGTTIRTLAEGYPTQRVTIVAQDTLTTIDHLSLIVANPIYLRSGADRTLKYNESIELLFTGSEWVEL